MSDTGLYKQMKRDFRRKLKEHGVTVNVNYANKDQWGKPVLAGTLYNVKVFMDVITNLNIEKYQYANVKTGKTVFYIPWSYKVDGVETSIQLSDKDWVEIEHGNRKFVVNGVVPCDPIGDEYLCQLAIQQ